MKAKKIVSLLLCLILVLSSFGGLTAFADESKISYLVDTAQDNGKTRYIYYPKELQDTTKVYPLIVWANATGFNASKNLQLFDMLSKEGYIIVASNEKFAGNGTDQIASLDYILSRNKKSGDMFYKRVSTVNITALGHSQGGMSTVNACANDKRFSCAISIAGNSSVNEAKRLSTPTLFFTGTGDWIVPSSQYVSPAYNNCKGPAVYVSLKGGSHTACWDNDKPSAYANYILKWIKAWNNNDNDALRAFEADGELANDPAWQDYAAKKLRTVFKGDATISATKFVYNGTVRTPKVTVTDKNGNIIPQSNYEVKYAAGRKDVGTYNVSVTFKNHFAGTAKKSFTITINPKPTEVKNLTKTTNGFKLTWKKITAQTTGYQIQYSLNSNFNNGTKVKVTNNTKTSKTISGLKSNKKYYVRIRTYKNINGKYFYSTWTKKKAITIK